MDRNMPPGAKVLGEFKESKTHNKEQFMENSMKGPSYNVSKKDLENGYVNTGDEPGDREFYISTGVPRLVY